MITEPPDLSQSGFDVAFPDAARKNGVQGTVKVTAVLGENGRTRDIVIVDDLAHGVGQAVSAAVQKFAFRPAKFNGTPTAMKMTVLYSVTVYYDEGDKDVTKPKIIEKPMPAYPESQRASGVKGKVMVTALLKPDGDIQVLGANSDMERVFDKAAQDAAKNLKFSPAVHKKSKQPVAQVVVVEYAFKP